MNWLKRNINIQWFLSIIVLFSLVACGDNNTSNNGPNEQVFDVSLYVGTYEGTWTNNTTGATGAARIDIAVNESNKTATMTLDFDGKYLGLDDPPPTTLTGTYDSTGAKVKGKNDLFGEYDITIDINGNIVGLVKQPANGTIPEITYTGIITKDKLDADYVVKLADGQTVSSILRMQKQNAGAIKY